MKRILVGPFNRVEGDLEISLDLDGGQIVEARVNAPLFRGFEQVLIGRAPSDALAVVPRICGICSVAQSAAAAGALAAAAGLEPAPNGRLAQHLIQATENLADHLTHFYLFFMPDFARTSYVDRAWYASVAGRFAALKGSANPVVLLARANFLKLTGLLAGRWPHTLAIQPGGSTKAMTGAERIRILAILRDFRAFLESTLIGDRLENFTALASENALRAWCAGRAGDFPAFLTAAHDLHLEQTGRASDRFMSFGAYDLFAAGLWQPNVTVDSLNVAKITEDPRRAWMMDSAPLPPAIGQTIVDAEKQAPIPGAKHHAMPGRPSRLAPWRVK